MKRKTKLKFLTDFVKRFIKRLLSKYRKVVIISYSDPERSKALDLINEIKAKTEMELLDNEAYQIYMAVKRTGKVCGDLAEVGVYKGGSARLICEAKGNKALHLFDTFEGIPVVHEIDSPHFRCGMWAGSLEEVGSSLRAYKDVYFYKGIFPNTTGPVKDKKFSFVHMDVDTHKSTLDCLEFFYSRINPGGVIISHDYIYFAGVKKAFDEFFKDKPEPIIELSGSQCLIAKI
ncbi:MAG: TylF/MycF family methyltransferase [Omnitrophica bacterium]|nr:TylF/MycF family methyltransferase [Candidatus Omnitrophota bacterium]